MRPFLAIACALLLSVPALAESDGGIEDAGIDADAGTELTFPDGSVGEGGADRDQQEGDDSTGRVPGFCRYSIECPRTFQCQDGRCRYTGVRRADGPYGCGSTAASAAFPIGVLVAFASRRRRR